MQRSLFRVLIALACGAAAAAASAQQSPAPAASATGFDTVSQALAALRARDGNGTVVTDADGWTIINEPLASAQWSFVPTTHEAYPAVVRRIVRRGADGKPAIETASLCEAPGEACARLLAEFEALNSRISQAVRGRGLPPRPPQ